MSTVSSDIHSVYLNEIIYNFKNDLVSGNYRGFRNQISSLIEHDIFSDYEIVHEGKVVESSETFLINEGKSEFIKVTIPVYFDENKSEKWGAVDLLVKNSTRNRINEMIYRKLKLFGGIFLFIFFFISTIYIFAWQKINFALSNQVDNIFRGNSNEKRDLSSRLWAPLLGQLSKLKSDHDKLIVKDFDDRQQKLLVEISRQVAHDIRSPLSALNMVAGVLDEVSEDKRSLIRSSISRINEIANDLLSKGKSQRIEHFEGSDERLIDNLNCNRQLVSLPDLIDSLISEKKMQYISYSGIKIVSNFDRNLKFCISADQKEFSRLLSNLINNSVEAITDSVGEVSVDIRLYKDTFQLTVSDNGKGIPSQVLAKLGDRGITFGKEGSDSGSGLGIYHAKKYVESIGGKFVVLSQVDVGTQVNIYLPIVSTSKK
jgi:signal transduction histidine kinase